jgi:hypothetical protein
MMIGTQVQPAGKTFAIAFGTHCRTWHVPVAWRLGHTADSISRRLIYSLLSTLKAARNEAVAIARHVVSIQLIANCTDSSLYMHEVVFHSNCKLVTSSQRSACAKRFWHCDGLIHGEVSAEGALCSCSAGLETARSGHGQVGGLLQLTVLASQPCQGDDQRCRVVVVVGC